MNDTLFINDVTLPCTIGVFDFERQGKQTVIINIALSVALHKPGKTDNLKDTVNYHEIYLHIVDLVENSNFFLLEALAEAIATICLQDKKVQQVKVHIEKPKAVALARSSAVEIIRKNEK